MNDSLLEARLISKGIKKKGLTRCFIYNGGSMASTFRPGQLLFIRPVEQNLTVGDVIVFEDPINHGYIVHRIISNKAGQELITRGDNNRLNDPVPVRLDQIVGKVELAEQSGRTMPIIGGWRGLGLAKFRWAARRLDNSLRRFFWLPYQALRVSGLAGQFWRPKIIKLELKTKNGSLVKYIHNQHTIALWHPMQQRFECRKPYDLVIPKPGINQ